MSIESIPMMQLGSPEEVRHFAVYSYDHLDDLSFARNPDAVFKDSAEVSLASYLEAIRTRFKEAGWEGDGTIRVVWLPPFVDVGIEDTWGTYVWCVKQSNNGTAWLASPVPLNFKRLAAQNESLPHQTRARLGLMFTECSGFVKRLKQLRADAKRKVDALQQVSDPIFENIRSEILLTVQGDMVAQFNVFLDDCYLEVLDEVLGQGNTSNLHLSKFKASLEPREYLPSTDLVGDEEAEANKWFTIRGLIRDIWITYQFEPFPQKVSMLFKACEFSNDSLEMRIVKKHVHLRNCVQHHERQVTSDALRLTGLDRFEMMQDDGTHASWKIGSIIVFSLAEIDHLADALLALTEAFYKHTTKRIRRRVWIHRTKKQN
jgi:hypothetical protein